MPGDRPERFDKAAASGADGLILDLEDAVATSAKYAARTAVAARLCADAGGVALFVRVNPLNTPFCLEDLAALRGLPLDAIVLPKAEGAASVRVLAGWTAEMAIDAPIMPIATETPAAMFQLGSYAEPGLRLAGLTWGAEILPAAMGAATSRESDGRYTPPYELGSVLLGLNRFGIHERVEV